MLFIANASAGRRGNLTPKGLDTFWILRANDGAGLDLVGSGNKTQAHLAASGHITRLFCAFDYPATVLRRQAPAVDLARIATDAQRIDGLLLRGQSHIPAAATIG